MYCWMVHNRDDYDNYKAAIWSSERWKSSARRMWSPIATSESLSADRSKPVWPTEDVGAFKKAAMLPCVHVGSLACETAAKKGLCPQLKFPTPATWNGKIVPVTNVRETDYLSYACEMVASPVRRSASKKDLLMCSVKKELMQCDVKTDKYSGSDAVKPIDLSMSPWVDAVL